MLRLRRAAAGGLGPRTAFALTPHIPPSRCGRWKIQQRNVEARTRPSPVMQPKRSWVRALLQRISPSSGPHSALFLWPRPAAIFSARSWSRLTFRHSLRMHPRLKKASHVARNTLKAIGVLGVLGTGGGLAYLWHLAVEQYPQLNELSLLDRARHLVRFSRTALVGFLTTIDYKYTLYDLEEHTEEYREARSMAHNRTAKRLLKLCMQNAGVYVKAGQHIASMNHVLPAEYTTTMSVLQDKAPHHAFSEVEKVFLKELGKSPSEIFLDFDKVPIAAASLAQVHRAHMVDGREVAVKVQHDDFQRLCYGDLFAISTAIKTIAWFSWIVPEFEKNLNMEMDFVNEGKNAERAASNFAHNKQVGVPQIIWPLTRRKILCMEFIRGVKITDVAGLDALKIFVHGFIHSDPHPGNLLVQKMPDGRPKIILLDHGLYRELTPEFRKDYCNLWKAIVLRDKEAIEKYCRKMGAGDFFQMFVVVLTFRPLNEQTGVALVEDSKMSIDQIRLMRAQMREQNFKERIAELLENLDRQLLLVLRTNNLVRSIIKELGAYSNVDRFLVMARYSVRGLHAETGTGGGWLQAVWRYKDMMVFEFRLEMYGLVLWAWQLWTKWYMAASNFFASFVYPPAE